MGSMFGRAAQRQSTPLARLASQSRIPAALATRSTTMLDSMLDYFWTLRNREESKSGGTRRDCRDGSRTGLTATGWFSGSSYSRNRCTASLRDETYPKAVGGIFLGSARPFHRSV